MNGSTYVYGDSSRPYALTSAPGTASYTYYRQGFVRTKTAGGQTQTFNWTVDGKIDNITGPCPAGGGTCTAVNIYTAAGNRIVRRDMNGARTIYVGIDEISTTTLNGAKTARRAYTIGSTAIGVRTPTGYTITLGDHHGTPVTTITGATVTTRRFTPYGTIRGTNPAWVNDHKYLNQVQDPTNITYLNARYYDQATGHFLSVDPLITQTRQPYLYASGNPVGFADPTGLCWWDCLGDILEAGGDILGDVATDTVDATVDFVEGANDAVSAPFLLTYDSVRSWGSLFGIGGDYNPTYTNTSVQGLQHTVQHPTSVITDCLNNGAYCSGTILGSLLLSEAGAAARAGTARLTVAGISPTASVAEAASEAVGTALEPMWAQAPTNGFLGGWSTTETLQPGTLIDRYGADTGRFFSPAGTSFEARALPAGAGPLNAYEVLKPFDVQGGIAAPAFGQPGLGIQYMAPQTVADLIEDGLIKVVAP